MKILYDKQGLVTNNLLRSGAFQQTVIENKVSISQTNHLHAIHNEARFHQTVYTLYT